MLLLPAIAYWPALQGGYFLDDYPNIVNNQFIQIHKLDFASLWTAMHSTDSGPLGRPLALASFALNYALTGLDPFYFKLTNLVIHLFTGCGILLLVNQIFSRLTGNTRAAFWLAFSTALLWLVHPLNVSTVMYVVQRMTALAAFFTVWGLVAYMHGRVRILEQRPSGWQWVMAGLLIGGIGLFAKENAILMVGYLFAIEWAIFRFEMPSRMQRLGMQLLFCIALIVPVVWMFGTHLLSQSWITTAYAKRPFTLDERLLTETRVLWDYIGSIWLPNIQHMGLYHDDYPVSHGFFAPASTALAIAGHAVLVLAAIFLRRRFPIFSFAVAWFYIGHSVEASVLPLELKYEHRNYLPMLGMLMLMAYGVYALTARLQQTGRLRVLILFFGIVTFAGSTFVRASQFGDFWSFAPMEAEHRPLSSRANQNAAFTLMILMQQSGHSSQKMIVETEKYLTRAIRANPDSTASLFMAILMLPDLKHQPPSEEMFNELCRRLLHNHPDAGINSYFVALLSQAADGKLRLSSAQVEQLFDAAEANPYMSPGTKADIIASRAAYAQSVMHDNQNARIQIDKALAMAPGRSGIYVPAVWIYQEAGQWQEASTFLERLKKLDAYGIERASIAWLSQRQLKQ